MEVMVSLGRLGEADYEGSSMRVRLEAGEPRHIRFTTAFRAAHPALKLQIYVADLGAARGADLMVDSLCVGSLPPQFAEEFTDGKLDFRAANTLLRSGRGAEAAAVYELLFRQNPLRIYRDNAKMAEFQELGRGSCRERVWQNG